MTSMPPLITLAGVGRSYGRGPLEVRVLDSVDLRVQRGAMDAISGPSGCGKTTMLNLLGALDKPSEGSVTVDSVDVGALSGKDQVAYRRKKVGFVFQTFNLIASLNALENVMLPMEFDRKIGPYPCRLYFFFTRSPARSYWH